MTTMGFLRNDNQKSKYTNISHIAPQDFKHILITGATGSGKTASLIMPTIEDRISKKSTVIFFEYKGHEHSKIKLLAWQNHRIRDVIELGKLTGSYFNLMSILNSRQLNSAIIKLVGESKDPYWSNAAAQLTVRVIEIHRKLYSIGNTFVSMFSADANIFTLRLAEIISSDHNLLTLKEEPSFATLAKITSTPKSLLQFFNSLKKLTKKLNNLIKNVYEKFYSDKEHKQDICYLIAEIEIFSDMVNKYDNFTVDGDSDDGTGNNGVIQILANAITLASATDSINIGQIDLMQEIEKKSIIIIDIQAIPSTIYGVFVESLLAKLTARIKFGSPVKVSIFLDEANRVLNKGMDISADVLREARTELILATQNEEQMTLKFGTTEWESIRKNIMHRYEIKSNYKVFYNSQPLSSILPFLPKQRVLEIAERKYNALNKNREYIENRFMLDLHFPKYYLIRYHANSFLQNQRIELHSKTGNIINATYVGENIKNKTEAQIKILSQKNDETKKVIDDQDIVIKYYP